MLDDVITKIIGEFPENNIVIRPFPGQVEKVKNVLKKASHLKSLTFSTSPCYIEDFSKTKVLILTEVVQHWFTLLQREIKPSGLILKMLQKKLS